jgi:hypothetical protein
MERTESLEAMESTDPLEKRESLDFVEAMMHVLEV